MKRALLVASLAMTPAALSAQDTALVQGGIYQRPFIFSAGRTAVGGYLEANGSWFGRWGVNYVYGTWQVLVGLAAVGFDMTSPPARRAVRWLKECQNADGGWGETCGSYDDPALAGRGDSICGD